MILYFSNWNGFTVLAVINGTAGDNNSSTTPLTPISASHRTSDTKTVLFVPEMTFFRPPDTTGPVPVSVRGAAIVSRL